MNTTSTNDAVIRRPAILINQPMGSFFVFSLDAETLNQVAYSLPARAEAKIKGESSDQSGYGVFGSQRKESPSRLAEIAKFIATSDATFPNAIILGANYDEDGNLILEPAERWSVESTDCGYVLSIPNGGRPVASIIDGQHRLHAFQELPPGAPQRKMQLLCVVFLDLPTAYHAYVFATINFNQKKVDRSLAYELFGFDVEQREPSFWAPETLAVYLARVLNTEPTSPFFQRISHATDAKALLTHEPATEAIADSSEKTVAGEHRPEIRVSMATVVDGLLRLISRKPKDDRYFIRRPENLKLGRRSLSPEAGLPLRDYYLKGNDRAILDIVNHFFAATESSIWKSSSPDAYIRKTVGVQALFDVLQRLVTMSPINAVTFSEKALSNLLAACKDIGLDGSRYQASGIGRTEIRNDLMTAIEEAIKDGIWPPPSEL